MDESCGEQRQSFTVAASADQPGQHRNEDQQERAVGPFAGGVERTRPTITSIAVDIRSFTSNARSTATTMSSLASSTVSGFTSAASTTITSRTSVSAGTTIAARPTAAREQPGGGRSGVCSDVDVDAVTRGELSGRPIEVQTGGRSPRGSRREGDVAFGAGRAPGLGVQPLQRVDRSADTEAFTAADDFVLVAVVNDFVVVNAVRHVDLRVFTGVDDADGQRFAGDRGPLELGGRQRTNRPVVCRAATASETDLLILASTTLGAGTAEVFQAPVKGATALVEDAAATGERSRPAFAEFGLAGFARGYRSIALLACVERSVSAGLRSGAAVVNQLARRVAARGTSVPFAQDGAGAHIRRVALLTRFLDAIAADRGRRDTGRGEDGGAG